MYNLILRNENTNSELKELPRLFEFFIIIIIEFGCMQLNKRVE
jgi:hypothetical protein